MNRQRSFLQNSKGKLEAAYQTAEEKLTGVVSFKTKGPIRPIVNWLQEEGWNVEHFPEFLKLVGLRLPVWLSEFNQKENSFKCTTALGSQVRVRLIFGDGIETSSEISITEDGEERSYITSGYNRRLTPEPKVFLQSKVIKRDGKRLVCDYSNSYCHRSCDFDNNNCISINIDNRSAYEDKCREAFIRGCNASIDEFLLEQRDETNIHKIYEGFMRMFDNSTETIAQMGNITFIRLEKTGVIRKVKEVVHVVNGKKQ
ncbi:MAG: hypothetical protein HFJ55_05935 [Clostridia bacterium]|jgi:hypothetical protein|nr:hypothetical protein [Clostridia bacterium]